MKYSKQNSTGWVVEHERAVRNYILQVYYYMTAALMITGLVARYTYSSEALMNAIYTMQGNQVRALSPLGWVILAAPMIISLAFGFGLRGMNILAAQILFWSYSILLGVSLSSIFLIYVDESIANIFFITAVIFAGMSIYGYTTEADLTSLGSFLFMGLIGIVIASLVNLLAGSAGLNFALSVLGVIIFTVLTAYDIQRIKAIHNFYRAGDKEMADKIAIIGALTLYLDFINIFVHLLQLLGKKKDNL